MLRLKARKRNDDEKDKKLPLRFLRRRRRCGPGPIIIVMIAYAIVGTVFGAFVKLLLTDVSNHAVTRNQEGLRRIRRIEDKETCPSYGCHHYPTDMDAFLLENDDFPAEQQHWAMLTRKSNRMKPPFNQDVAVVIKPFRTSQTNGDLDFFVGIFDGHGMQGHHVAKFAAEQVPEIVAGKFNERKGYIDNDSWISQVLKDAFNEADLNAPPINAMSGGTTASVTIRRGDKLFFANAGDSRTILVTMSDDNEANISFSTRLDKAHLPEESARIKSLGGVIRYPQNKTQLSRVWVYSTTARETIGLAMSRSIGDWEWGAVGVIAEPLVDVIDLGPKVSKTFLLAASDGMWDMRLRPQFFANRFGKDLFTEKTHPLRLCYEVIEAISPRNSTFYRDDITIVFMML